MPVYGAKHYSLPSPDMSTVGLPSLCRVCETSTVIFKMSVVAATSREYTPPTSTKTRPHITFQISLFYEGSYFAQVYVSNRHVTMFVHSNATLPSLVPPHLIHTRLSSCCSIFPREIELRIHVVKSPCIIVYYGKDNTKHNVKDNIISYNSMIGESLLLLKGHCRIHVICKACSNKST